MEKRKVEIRGLTIEAGRSAVAVPLVAANGEELSIELSKAMAVRSYIDLLEYRADDDPLVLCGGTRLKDRLRQIRTIFPATPVLFTIRTIAEGGKANLSYEEYRQINLEAALSGLVDLVDVELFTAGEKGEALVKELHQAGVSVIGSSHDFHSTPDKQEMLHRIETMQNMDMDITKLAVMPQKRQDVLRLLETAVTIEEEIGDRPCVTMSMGRLGTLSRISGGFTGNAITFATAGKASAPGQLSAEKLRQILEALPQPGFKQSQDNENQIIERQMR